MSDQILLEMETALGSEHRCDVFTMGNEMRELSIYGEWWKKINYDKGKM